MAPPISPSWASYGVTFLKILEEIDNIITTPDLTCFCVPWMFTYIISIWRLVVVQLIFHFWQDCANPVALVTTSYTTHCDVRGHVDYIITIVVWVNFVISSFCSYRNTRCMVSNSTSILHVNVSCRGRWFRISRLTTAFNYIIFLQRRIFVKFDMLVRDTGHFSCMHVRHRSHPLTPENKSDYFAIVILSYCEYTKTCREPNRSWKDIVSRPDRIVGKYRISQRRRTPICYWWYETKID